jgi:rhodanese-related sulfurtransferase
MRPLSPGALQALTIGRDALLVTLLAAAVGLTFNWVNERGIPLLAERPYEIFVPCPEPLGEVKALSANDALLKERVVLIDARPRADYERWHARGAIHLEFDFLSPVSADAVRRVAASGAMAVVVYGDGGNPDSGQELARELAGRGVRNVHFVEGGAPALRRASQGSR